jgi:uncharacterized protein YjiS (DUF1127 family)
MFETLRERRAFGQGQSGREKNRPATKTPARAASVHLHNGLPLWASLDGPPARWAPTQLWSLSSVIRQWRQRARTRQQLCRLSDHMLKDIGLSREEVGHEFPRPLGRFD